MEASDELAQIFSRMRSNAELQEEIRTYLEGETAENIARGMPSEEAQRQMKCSEVLLCDEC